MAPVAAKAPVRESVEPTTMGSPVGSPPAAGDSPAEPSSSSSAQAVRTMATATSAATLASERCLTLHRVLSSNVSGGVDDRAADDGEHRLRAPHVVVADREVVAVEHQEVGELADFDRAQIVLSVEVPGIATGVGVQRLLATDLLPGVDLLAEPIEAGGCVVQGEPRVVRCDVDAVLVQAVVDAAGDDLREQRADRGAGRTRTALPAQPRHGEADIERLQSLQLVLGGEVAVLQAPPKVGDAELGVHRLVGLDDLLDVGHAALGVLVA